MHLNSKELGKNKRRIITLLHNDKARQWYMTWIVGREWYLIMPLSVYMITVNIWLAMLTYGVLKMISYLLRLWVIWDFADTMITGAILRAELIKKKHAEAKLKQKV